MTRRTSDAAAKPGAVRVVMTKSMQGSEDGLRVQRYEQGQEYDMEQSLAASFIKSRCAKPVSDPVKEKDPDGGDDSKGGKGPDENK